MSVDSELHRVLNHSPGSARALVGFSLIVGIVSGAWLTSGASTEQPGWRFAILGPFMVCAAVAMVSLFVARDGVIERRTRIAWFWIALAFAFRTIGEAGAPFFPLGGFPTGTTAPDFGSLPTYPSPFAGFLTGPL